MHPIIFRPAEPGVLVSVVPAYFPNLSRCYIESFSGFSVSFQVIQIFRVIPRQYVLFRDIPCFTKSQENVYVHCKFEFVSLTYAFCFLHECLDTLHWHQSGIIIFWVKSKLTPNPRYTTSKNKTRTQYFSIFITKVKISFLLNFIN